MLKRRQQQPATMSAPSKKKKTGFSDEVTMKEYDVSSSDDDDVSDSDDSQIDMHVDKGWGGND